MIFSTHVVRHRTTRPSAGLGVKRMVANGGPRLPTTRTFASPTSLIDINSTSAAQQPSIRRRCAHSGAFLLEICCICEARVAARVRAHLTDVVALRCSHLPSERHAGGFLRAVYLASGSARGPCAGGGRTPLAAASTPRPPSRARCTSSTGWTRAPTSTSTTRYAAARLVWLAPSESKPKPTKLRFTDALATAWTTPMLLRSVDPDAAARAVLSREIQEAPDAQRCGGAPARASRRTCSAAATATPTLCARFARRRSRRPRRFRRSWRATATRRRACSGCAAGGSAAVTCSGRRRRPTGRCVLFT